MKNQNYNNHIRYYTPHHFVFYPVVIILLIASIIGAYKSDENTLLWLVLSGTIILIGWLSFMLRQHYALGNQNRIVRLELRFRYYVLTQQRFESIEQQLTFSQQLALRFASDEELIPLIERTLKENLSADDIKKAVKHWLPDYMRA
ncbi:MAG: hypothetical protein HY062_01900 [Bacteroidetes bacterium]|nr:hypothetical protein [Bacteroidota bacterium]